MGILLLAALRIGLLYPRLGTAFIFFKKAKKSSKQKKSNMFTLKERRQLAN